MNDATHEVNRHGEPIGEVYLDWNATSPIAPEVVEAMARARDFAWANPASVHGAGRRARKQLEETREQLGAVLGVHPRDVLFTGSGTEANNLALSGASGLITSRLEHPSVTRLAERLEQQGRPVRWLPVTRAGLVEVAALPELAQGMPRGSWLASMLVNHETGVIQPLAELTELAHARGLKVHCDAVQALGKMELEAISSVDSIVVTAHKLRGPKGIGALALRSFGDAGAPLPQPVLVGGSQERGLRPGTQDAVLAAGFGAALQRLELMKQALRSISELRNELERGLAGRAEVNGAAAPRAHHVSNLRFPGWRGDELVAALDLAGICVSAGSACSAGTLEPSPVLNAMLGAEVAVSGVRFSLGETTSRAEVERVLELLLKITA